MERNQKRFLEIKNFINSTTCEKIKKEINKFNRFDDLVMRVAEKELIKDPLILLNF